MSTDLEFRLATAMRLRAQQIDVDPVRLDPASVDRPRAARVALLGSVAAVIVVAIGLLAFGLRHDDHATMPAGPPDRATITGVMWLVGGAPQLDSPSAADHISTGTVTAYRGATDFADPVEHVRTDGEGRFTLLLPAGTYRLGGDGMIYLPPLDRPACLSDQVTVTAGEQVMLDVVCAAK